MTVTKFLPENELNPWLLGRHVVHDPKSLEFASRALPYSAIKKVEHTRHIPILNQQDLLNQGILLPGRPDGLSSCTGNAGIGLVGTGGFFARLAAADQTKLQDAVTAERYAIGLYEAATKDDEFTGAYPPNDNGSSGLGVAKALKSLGIITKYEHAFGLRAMLTALQSGPVLVGTNWYESMFTVGHDGTMGPITGAAAGGHEYLCDAVYPAQKMLRFANSWGTGWGNEGYFFMTYDQMTQLLGEQGDCVVPR